MAVNLSMLAGAGAQFFDNNGVILSGGLVYTYTAGTTTPQTTYTTSAGNVAHTNPIVLDSAGRVASGGEIWLTDAVAYKFVLKTSVAVTIATYDNVTGNSSGIYAAFAASSGSSLVGYTQGGTGAVATTVQNKLRQTVSVKDFGAVGNGTTDDTAAITSAFNYAMAQTFAQVTGNPNPILTTSLYFPPGRYVFNGPALDYSTNFALSIYGDNRQTTQIMLAAGIYFVNSTQLLYSTDIRGINFNGGLGAFHQAYTGVNVQGTHVFEDCGFYNYTECAIGFEASDMPYLMANRNIFYGTITSIGILTSGLPDGGTISNNAFLLNKYGIKLQAQGVNININGNDFIRFANGGGSPLTDIWIVPGSQSIGAVGLRVNDNKFGNENLNAADYRILIAPENTSVGTNHATYPASLTVSSGWVNNLTVKGNQIISGPINDAFIVSWTKNLFGCEVRNKNSGSDIPVLRYGAGVYTPSGNYNGMVNTFEMIPSSSDITGNAPPEPVTPYAGTVVDVNAQLQGSTQVNSYWQSGLDPAYKDLTTYSVFNGTFAAFTLATGTAVSITDAIGGGDAVEFTATGSGFVAFQAQGVTTANRNAFVEFDVMASATTPILTLDFSITNNVNTADIAVRRLISLSSTPIWKRIRIPFNLGSLNSTYNLVVIQVVGYSAGVATKFKIGRLKFYHANEPQNSSTATLQSSTTFNPNAGVAIANNASAISGDIALTGTYVSAAFGDFVQVSAPYDLQGCTATGFVSSAGNVKILVTNQTGGAITFVSGLWNVRLLKR